MIKTENLCYSYSDGSRALNGISFEIRAGQRVGIIGANGAGKTTLLHLLCAAEYPTEGRIFLDGREIDKKGAKEVRQRVGLLFQNSDDQLFTNSVYDDIAFGPRHMGLDDEEVRSRTAGAMEKTGVMPYADKPPYHLSGGEKKLAAIASLLSMQPDILLLDEPSGELDPRARREFIALIKGMGQTMMIASHDIDLIRQACDRTIIIKKGEIMADGPTDRILDDEELLLKAGL